MRIGEDVSERLEIVPAESLCTATSAASGHASAASAWCKSPLEPQVIDKVVPTGGLVAHTLVAHFVDHRLEQINARSGVHTPRATLAAWAGGASLKPLYDAHRAFVLSALVLQADETPMRMLEPGAGKTAKAHVWAKARGEHDGTPGVIYDFCTCRGSRYPADFLNAWRGTLTCDDYGGYDVVFKREGCIEAGCIAHARRKVNELAKANASPAAAQAIVRIAPIYRVGNQARELTAEERLASPATQPTAVGRAACVDEAGAHPRVRRRRHRSRVRRQHEARRRLHRRRR